MDKIVNHFIKAFESRDKDILIFDENLRPFYAKKNDNHGGKIRFNLPVGTFYTENNLRPLKERIRYKLNDLPAPTKITPLPEKFSFRISPNPNKCSTNLQTGVMVMDTDLAKESRCITDFVKFHELGHYYYSGDENSEKNCDIFAINKMLENGYNPSQCASVKYCISCANDERKKNIQNFLHYKKH
jgi:hypothetical protein